MSEMIAKAVHSKNLQQKETHCALDVIGAIGIAAMHNPIGVDAARFLDGLQAKAHKDLTYGLAREAGKKIKCDKQILLRVCKQVIHESAFSFCKTCNGRKEALIDEHVIKCAVCNGTGLHRHTDMQRAHNIGIGLEIYLKHWAERLSLVQSIFTNERRNAIRITKIKLNKDQ
jgi:hypothetical protein